MKRFNVEGGKVYIVGAGPGAPDLIAVRGKEIIEQADLVLYADSLVEYSVADIARKPGAEIVPSSGLHLGQMVDLMVEAAKAGKVVARVHSGDPALYGATHEQMALLEDHEVPYEIIPGITAAFAAAAVLQSELTIPDLVQTIILTRTAGRTTMPEKEDLRSIAAIGSSLAIYLSVTRIKKVIDDLLASGGYTLETPCAVLHKTTWPDESYVIGTLNDIAEKVRKAGYTKHALILVSPALDQGLKGADRRTSSHLYDKSYTHRFRKAEDFSRGKEKAEAKKSVAGTVRGEKHLGEEIKREGTAVIGITKNGSALAAKLARLVDGETAGPTLTLVPAKFANGSGEKPNNGLTGYSRSVLNVVRQQWADKANLILVMPTGVASRAIGPLLKDKANDPAVVCLDEAGRFVIPLLGGHQAGANAIAEKIAAETGGYAAITTASDVQDKPALDLLGKIAGWKIAEESALTHTAATLVNGELIGIVVADELRDNSEIEAILAPLLACDNVEVVPNLEELDIDEYLAGVIVSHKQIEDHQIHLARKSIVYRPPVLTVGMGCKKGVAQAVLENALTEALADAGLSVDAIGAISTADLKAEEAGLVALADKLGVKLMVVGSNELKELNPAGFSESAATEKFGIAGVAEPTAVLVSGGELVVQKRSFEVCTVAVAIKGRG